MPFRWADTVRAIDISRYQRKPGTPAEPNVDRRFLIDFVDLASANPELRLVMPRLTLWNAGVDWDFVHNYDEAERAGFDLGPYIVNDPTVSAKSIVDYAERSLDGRRPPLLVMDCERSGGLPASAQARQTKELLDLAAARFHFATVIVYTNSGYWTTNIGFQSWARDWILFAAHYIYKDARTKSFYTDFESLEQALPFESRSTPYLAEGWKIRSHETVESWERECNLGGWQYSDRGVLAGLSDPRDSAKRPKVDLSIWRRSVYASIFGAGEPDPKPTISDELRLTAATLREQAARLDDLARDAESE